MNPALLVVALLLLAALAIYGIFLYNSLVTVRNNVDRAWGNVDVILRQRADEVPNLVAAVKGYAAHERALFEAVAHARATLLSAAPPAEKAQASAELQEATARLLAVAEAYPDLRASGNFLALQKRLSSLEDLLADRREFYNESVAILNTRIQEFPDLLVARPMALTPREYFRAEGAAREVPRVETAA